MNYNHVYFGKSKFLTSLLFLIISLFSIHAQSADTLEIKDNSEIVFDSLLAIVNSTDVDTIKINVLNEIAWEFAPTNFEKSMLYSDSAQTLAKEIRWAKGEAIALKNAGEALRFNGRVEESILKFETCIPIFERLNDQNEVARVYNHLGLSNRRLSNLEKAYEYYIKALNINSKQNNIEGQLKGYTYLGTLFYKFDNLSKSLDYYKKALSFADHNVKNSTYASIVANIGLVYSEQNRISEALENYQRAAKIYKKLNNLRSYAQNLSNIADLYLHNGDFSQAIIFCERAIHYSRKTKVKKDLAFQFGNLAEIQFKYVRSDKVISMEEKSQLLDSSIENYNKSIKLFVELGNKVEQSNDLKSLAELYEETNNFELALSCLKKASIIDDSLQMSNVKQTIADAEHKKDIDLKIKEIEVLNAENEYNNLVKAVLLTLALVLIISVGYFYHQYLSIKHHSKLLEENIRIRDESEVALMKNEQELKNHKFQLEMIVNKRISKLESEVNERKLSEDRLLEAIEKVEADNTDNAKLKIIPKNRDN